MAVTTPKRAQRIRRLRLMLGRIRRVRDEKRGAGAPASTVQVLNAECLALEWVLDVVDPKSQERA